MVRRRLAAAALVALIAALFVLPDAASGAQSQDQALVRVALLLLAGVGLAGVTGFVVQQRRSTG